MTMVMVPAPIDGAPGLKAAALPQALVVEPGVASNFEPEQQEPNYEVMANNTLEPVRNKVAWRCDFPRQHREATAMTAMEP